MHTSERIERTLERAIVLAQGAGAPPLLASAMHYAVFPGGHRIRPQLCLAVSLACGDKHPAAADAAAAAIELLHCASLVHDDLPCFDDADTRRGKPSVHARYGAPIAVLTGDALIVSAFGTLAREASASPKRLGALLSLIAAAVGAPGGIRRRPGLGVRSRDPARRLSTSEDGRLVRWVDARRGHGGRRRS